MYRDQRNYENLNRAKFRPRLKAGSALTMRKAARTRRTKPFTFSWTTTSSTACGRIPTPILICCGASRPYARRIFQPIRTSRKPFKSGTITASIGSARIGKATGSRLFRPSLGATKAASSGALTVNLWVALWPFPVLERSLTGAPQSFSGSAMMKCSAV